MEVGIQIDTKSTYTDLLVTQHIFVMLELFVPVRLP